MRKFMLLTTAGMMTLAVSVSADERTGPPEKKKDLCVLYGQDCPPEKLTIQEKLQRIEAEIAKGTEVYTPQELERLKQKLRTEEDVWDFLTQ